MAQTQIETVPPAVDSGHIGTDRVDVSPAESYAYCQALAKRTAGNFYFTFLTLRRERFRAMCALYGFMRVCDDLSNAPGMNADEKAAALREWRRQLGRAGRRLRRARGISGAGGRRPAVCNSGGVPARGD